MGRAQGWIEAVCIMGMILICALLTWIATLAADRLVLVLGRTGADVVGRISGMLLAGLAIQFIFDGLAASPFIHR